MNTYLKATMPYWQKFSDRFNKLAIKVNVDGSTYGIRLLLGTDAVHSNQHVIGTILFPHNIGMAATHN